jgi:hypothetical protein
MFPSVQSQKKPQPAIYYVVKGRLSYSKLTNSFVPFEEKFIHENPILAREQAFSFYKNYAAILEEHEQLFHKPLDCPYLFSNENFGGLAIQKFSVADVKYQNPMLFDKGIAIYMVVQNPIKYMHKTDEKEERFLIHGIWNFDKIDVENLTNGLIREFGYYLTFKYETIGYDEVINFSVFDAKRFTIARPKLYTILSTPFSWHFNYYLYKNKTALQKSNRIKNIQRRIHSGNLIDNAYLSTLNHKEIVKVIASLMNENGGFVFVGISSEHKSIPLFEETKINEFKSQIQMVLRKKFKEISTKIKLSLYKIGDNVVIVFEVSKSKQKGVFITEDHRKVFYRRNNFGLYKFNDPEKIVNYCMSRNVNLTTIQDILEQL